MERANENVQELLNKADTSFLKTLHKGDYSKANFVKLQDFKRKVFVIGVYDDPIAEMVPRDERSNL